MGGFVNGWPSPVDFSSSSWSSISCRNEGAYNRFGGAVSEAGPILEPIKRSILVVEDDEDSAESLALLIRLLGHDVRTARDGPEALAAAQAYRPGLALIDIGLPGMDGYEVARRMKQTPDLAKTVLVALTGYGGRDDRLRSEAAGFDRHLQKPVDFAELGRLLAL